MIDSFHLPMLPTQRSIGIFSVSQRAFAPIRPSRPVISRYMDAAVRQEKGKVVFNQAQR